jgi:hypothetical protein
MRIRRCLVVLTAVVTAGAASAVETANNGVVTTTMLDREVRSFLASELESHLAAIPSFDPAPDRVHGALTTGEFTWGTFMRSLAAYAQLSGASTLAGRDLARTIGEVGLVEVRHGGTRFSQLYAAQSLRHYGSDLAANKLWQSLSRDERESWRTLLDPTRFYDPVKREVINLPENYLGVAARIAAMAWDTKLLTDRTLFDSLIDRAARQFTGGALYADDAVPTGRFDRYSNEYARYVWDAAEIAGRKDVLDALRPSLNAQMRLWWDLLAPDGYGYQWGRSLGVVGYLDTIEIAGFLAANPEFRPAPLDQIAAAYYNAWRWLRRDYKDTPHLLSVFDFGRGNYGYINREREWQQTTGFFGKVAHAHRLLSAALTDAGVERFPATPSLAPVARYEPFQVPAPSASKSPVEGAGRQAGVWVVRQGAMRFALPFTTGTRPGVADYLPAPHGLAGFAAPVEQVLPSLVPFVELPDGKTIVAADGADRIDAAADGRSVKATWTRWAQIGGRAADPIAPGLTAQVEWRLDGSSLMRTEQLTASAPMVIRAWRVVVPSTGWQWETTTGSPRTDAISGNEGRLAVTVTQSDWPISIRGVTTGDSPQGRGAKGPIPFHLQLEASNLTLAAGKPQGWALRLTLE